MNYKLLSVLALSALSACASTNPPLEPTVGPANVQFVQNAPKDRIRDTRTETIIRAQRLVPITEGKHKGNFVGEEIAGAECTLTSDHLRAKIVSPQVVRLPKYDQRAKLKNRGVPPSILVECRKGSLRGQSLLAAKPGKIVAGSGNLAVDLILIAGSAAAAATADWRYEPQVLVTMK